MGTCVVTDNLGRLNKEEVENMSRSNRSTVFESVIKSNPKAAQDQSKIKDQYP